MDGAHGAGSKTVQTTDATCIIDTAVFQINTSCIAGFDATAAFDTFFRDGKFEQTDSGNDAKRCSDRADCVAEQTLAPYGKGEDDHKRQDGTNAVRSEYASEVGIRIQQFEAERPADSQQADSNAQTERPKEGEMFRQWFAFPSGQEGDDVLRNAQRADNGAVEPSE